MVCIILTRHSDVEVLSYGLSGSAVFRQTDKNVYFDDPIITDDLSDLRVNNQSMLEWLKRYEDGKFNPYYRTTRLRQSTIKKFFFVILDGGTFQGLVDWIQKVNSNLRYKDDVIRELKKINRNSKIVELCG